MSKYERKERIEELIRQKIGELILTEEIVLRELFLSITKVKLTKDFREANVYITSLNKEQDCLETLKKKAGLIKLHLGKKIKLRHTPNLLFFIDKDK